MHSGFVSALRAKREQNGGYCKGIPPQNALNADLGIVFICHFVSYIHPIFRTKKEFPLPTCP